MTARRSYQVTGMSCEHCVNAVRGEVSRIPGVTDVDVDLDTGRVTVTSEQPLDDAAITAAVDEAGYAVASRPARPTGTWTSRIAQSS